ncbi:MAG: MFS transporter [Chlamydiales bacterium]|nr:MFS transporter [Chlamydiales bacterium]
MSATRSKKVKLYFHAWTIWLLSAGFMFYKYAIEISPSIMTSTLMDAFHINGTDLGNLAASYFYAYLILQIPAGLLIDRFGPRKVTTLSIAVCALGAFIFARSDTLIVACLGRFIAGAGAAFAAINCLKLTSTWFPPRQFALMAGLMMTLAMLGAVGGQAPLSALIELSSWRSVMEVIALVGFGLALLFLMVVRDASPEKRLEKKFSSEKASILKSLKKILTNSQSWLLSLYSGCAFAPVMVFGGLWGVSYIKDAYALTHNLAAQAVSLIFIGFAVGAPIFGWFSDWIGKRKLVMFWGTVSSLITISIVIYAPVFFQPLLTMMLFLFGFSISSFLLCFTMIQERHAPVIAATAIGFMNAFDALFGAISDPLAGKILDTYWTGQMLNGARIFSVHAYKMAFLLIPIFLVFALICLIGIKDTKHKAHDPSALP